MTDQLHLDVDAAPVEEILREFERRHGSYLDGVRTVLYVLAQERPVSMDDVHELIELGEIPPPPDDFHPNSWGGFFSQSDRFRATGDFIRSQRDGANGNLIRTWEAV